MGLFDIFSSPKAPERLLEVDVHSHLLPAIDDGSQSMDESIELIKSFIELGYKKAITTPHILTDYYPNTPEIINQKLKEVQEEIEKQNLNFQLQAAAEYYLDEFLVERIKQDETLLTFGDQFLLFEMAFMNISPFLNEIIFELKTRKYQPILAHVERYSYYYNNHEGLSDLIKRGCFLQVNLISLVGGYGKPAQKIAEQLIDKEMVHMLSTDCHNMRHLDTIKQVQTSKYYQKALDLPLINYSL